MKTFLHSIPPLLSILLISACFFTLVKSKKDCPATKRLSTSKLICYYSTVDEIDGCYCTHVILPANSDVKSIEKVRERAKGVKLYVSVNEFNQGLINLLKSSKVDGLEINLKKLDSKNDISDFISTIKSKIGSDLDLVLSVPSKSEIVAKYFDFKALSKYLDLFILQTAFLGASTNVTFHPSRLSGMWDMQNTDSVVDLISGLGAPLSKLVISAPVQAFQFTLQNEEYTAPGSPAIELKSITREELCKTMHGGKNWTMERDEDQAGPYIFRKNQWIAFEDIKSMDIKAKYSRVRGLAGIALKDLIQDGGAECESTILEATYNGLSRQSRAPRGAVLHSLEREILDSSTNSLGDVQLSPYRISRIIDTEGKIHVTRQDTRTEFQCSRQGYFVHPRSCNRFYRCVKFDQLSKDFNVFEFDCPAGLAFDERVEVCVWPGSLPHGTPCSGSSEIAPVPRKRFECPSEQGYYADPENCRWFFACLDHGKSPLSAYEFRCPFGLGFDGARLVCEWPWLVPNCANTIQSGLDSEYYFYGGLSGNGGYAGKAIGISAPGVILQNYEGLGTLGTIQLGGISGQIDKPIATVYSNVGDGTVGLGYQNNGGYIVGNGLSYKAAQQLTNAGLLKVNNGAGYQANGQNLQGVIYATSDYGSGNANIQHSYVYPAGAGQLGGQDAAVSTQGYTQYTGQNGDYNSAANLYSTGQLEGAGNLQYQDESGQYQDSNLHLVHGDLGGSEYAGTATGSSGSILHGSNQYQGASQQSGSYAFVSGASQEQDISSGYQNAYSGEQKDANYIYQSGNTGFNANGYDATKQGIEVIGYNGGAAINLGKQDAGYVAVTGSATQGNSGYINLESNENTDLRSHYANGEDFKQNAAGGAVSSQSFIQYHGQQENTARDSYNSGIKGNINIVGGGYSAVGTLGGIQISNNGDNVDVKTLSFSTTPAPIPVTTFAPVSAVSSVPTVTAVPVPGIKTSAGFETFRGGVIANVPELQYKVKSHGDGGFLANISSSFANFVVTTPATVAKEVIHQTYSQDGGYVYAKPENTFEEGPLNSITISTARPFLTVHAEQPKTYVSTTIKPLVIHENPVVISTPKPAVSVVTYQKYDANGGYIYNKPTVQFEEKPQGVVLDTYSTISTPKPTVYVSQQPQVYVASTPAAPAVSSYGFTQEVDQEQDGYYYNKPSVTFKEVPKNPTIISKFTIRKPAVQQQAVLINQIPYVESKPKAVVENYAYQQPIEPAVVSQYHYQQPSIQHQPLVPLYKQPELLATYTYQPPVQEVVYKQPATTYTYQNIAKDAVGLSNAQQQVTLTQKPVQTYSYQPSGGTSYQSVKFESNLQEKTVPVQSQGYVYPKPSNTFEERPQLEVKKSEGYVYQKPAVPFQETPIVYSTPKPIIAVQPAVVTSYFNTGSSKSTQASVEQQNVGYTYHKPEVKFNENPVIYSTPKPFVDVQPVTPAVVTSYFNIQSATPKPVAPIQPVIYSTPEPIAAKPIIPVEPVIYSTPKPFVVQPVVAKVPVQQAEVSSYNFIGSIASQPNIIVEEERPQVIAAPQPAVVATHFHQQPQQPVVSSGYDYPRPEIKFNEHPVVYSTPKPFVAVQPVTPAVVTSYFNVPSATTKPVVPIEPVIYSTPEPIASKSIVPVEPVVYSTPKPLVVAKVPVQQAEVSSYNFIGSIASQPNIIVEEEKPQVVLAPQPAVVTSYFNQQPSKPVVSKGYDYPKPSVQFVEEPQPILTTYGNREPVQEVPFVKKTAYVTRQYQQNAQKNYTYQQDLQENYQHTGYVYPDYEKVLNYVQSTPKPTFVSTLKTIVAKKLQQVTPATVTFYDSRLTSTPATYVSSTVAPEIKIESTTSRPISRFSFSSLDHQYQYNQNKDIGKSTASQSASYEYVRPTTLQPNIIVEEQEPVFYTPRPKVILEHQPAVVTSYFRQQPSQPMVSDGYDYPKPSVQYVEEPQPIREVPFIKKTAYVTGEYQQNNQGNYNYQQSSDGSYQQTGKVVVENYVHPNYEKVYKYIQSTPKPTFISTVKTFATENLEPVTPAVVTFYDSRLISTPASYVSTTAAPEIKFVSTTSRPISKFSFSSEDDQYQYNQYLDIVKSTTPEPESFYLPVTSRVRVTSPLPKISTTKVIEEYIAPEVTTLARDYLPVKIKSKTPAKEYLPVEVTTPSREYLPSRQRVKIISTTAAPEITTLYRDYLPVKANVRITTTGAPTVPTPIPVVIPTTVIKQNDAHPLLSTKLGAQCTCVSNTLRLRKKQKIIIVDDDDQNDDDDGYIVDDGSQGNYNGDNYESQKVFDVTPTPQVYVAPQTYGKKRVKVRPVLKQTYLPVTEVSDIFYRKESNFEESEPSEKEIAKAVRTGLKLVKQAAKDGAREGTQEALSGAQFDRYGPGGVRSRIETLQGAIDCQRAGLFRHPTECNKFYACRWDCTKNRFTLHVFNCPVQLTFDRNLGACNWPSQGPACVENTLITSD